MTHVGKEPIQPFNNPVSLIILITGTVVRLRVGNQGNVLPPRNYVRNFRECKG
jgi:hypothetical protein